ncbi:MAG: acyltransferase, partial [Frankia sp.]
MTVPATVDPATVDPATVDPAAEQPVVVATQPGPERSVVPRSLTDGHLYQIDLFRMLTFVAVIFVHATGGTTSVSSLTANGTLNLLHFTREAFFFLTAFVLFHTYYRRPPMATTFWRRRFLLVGVPYVAWSVFYGFGQVRQVAHDDGLLDAAGRLGWLLITGDAYYHLYFLLVTLQVYLFFPLILKLVRRTEGHHGLLLAASVVLQAAILLEVQYGPPRPGLWGVARTHAHVLLLTYQLWVVIGALAAVHLRGFHARVGDRPGRALAVTAGGAAVATLSYAEAIRAGQNPFTASGVFQPIMILWAPAMIVGLYAVGSMWARRRRPGGRVDAFVMLASEISFGVYLVHPAVLNWVLRVLPGLAAPVSTVVTVMVT